MDDKTQSESKQNDEEEVAPEPQLPKPSAGGWGFLQFSFLSDLQKAAAVAAEEISRNVRFEMGQKRRAILFYIFGVNQRICLNLGMCC